MYRKPTKPPPKMPEGWPYSDPKPSGKYQTNKPVIINEGKWTDMDDEIERMRQQRINSDNLWTTVRALFMIACGIGFVMGLVWFLVTRTEQDNAERRRCHERGGHVVEVHNGRYGEWICEGDE